MGPVLNALLKELEAAAKDFSAEETKESERKAKILAALSKVAESLSGLLRKQRAEAKEQMSERSAQDAAAQARNLDAWREIESRLARPRAAQDPAADHETAGPPDVAAASP